MSPNILSVINLLLNCLKSLPYILVLGASLFALSDLYDRLLYIDTFISSSIVHITSAYLIRMTREWLESLATNLNLTSEEETVVRLPDEIWASS